MSKERPILMSGPLVREILAGRKTMTRRPVKPQPGDHPNDDGYLSALLARCPYGHPGDRLWVKERIERESPSSDFSRYVADGAPTVADAWPWLRPSLPSIHMPRGLSRLKLDIVAVGIERLASIVDCDAKKEGVADRAAFIVKWQEIYGDESWDANPWVWVIEFRRVEAERSAA
jgi:hypothetical protein